MVTALLILIVVLLIGLVAMMLIGWPGREKKEIEKTGRELRRELAQHRADSIQLLHAMRIDLEESIRESLERQFESFEVMNRRAPSRHKKSSSNQGVPSRLEVDGNDDVAGTEDVAVKRCRASRFQVSESDRQLPLFDEPSVLEEPVLEKPEYIVSQVFADDDLPDIEEDLADV